MSNTENLFFEELIKELLTKNYLTKTKQNELKISLAKKHNFKRIVKNPEIIAHSNDKQRENIIKILNIKPVRELSGVTVVALFAKPHSCPHGKWMRKNLQVQTLSHPRPEGPR